MFFQFVKNNFVKQTLKYILEYVLNNLKIAESKHSIILALNGVILAFAVNYLMHKNTFVRYCDYLVIALSGLSIISSFFALHARSIRVKDKQKNIQNKNLLHYKNLSYLTSLQLVESVKEQYNFPQKYKPDNFDLDLASTIIANSKIVEKKYLLFNRSTLFCTLAILSALAMFFIIGVTN